MARTRALLVVLSCALALVACTDPPAHQTTPPAGQPSSDPPPSSAPSTPVPAPSGVVEVSCGEVIDRRRAPDGHEVVLDVVALPTGIQLHPAASGEPGWLFAKHGLLVSAGAEVELVVPQSVAGHARVGWGASGRTGTRLRVPGCQSEPGWLVFAGGYEVDAPMCLPLTVQAGGRQQQVRIPVGKPCPVT